MDVWNPWIDEKIVERVPFWRVLLAEAVAVLTLVLASWALALFLLSLDRVS
jgi:hypothetical protein